MAKNEYRDLVTIVRLNNSGLLECLDGFSTKDAVSHTSRVMTKGEHYILVGASSKLIESIMTNGGTKEDLIDAIKYGLCCLDAEKYGLDLVDAQIKFRYHELYSKYVA